jgi:hypothetical protein
MIRRFGSETSLIGIAAPLGAPAFVITAVGADVTEVDPAPFLAITRTRMVLLTSTVFSAYVFSVAPLIAEQLPPLRSQRRHWYA